MRSLPLLLATALTLLLLTSCENVTDNANNDNNQTQNDTSSTDTSGTVDTLSLADVQGKWARTEIRNVFDTYEGVYTYPQGATTVVLEITPSSIIRYRDYGTWDESIDTMAHTDTYYGEMPITRSGDIITFHNTGTRGANYELFTLIQGDISTAFGGERYGEEFRFPSTFIGSWYESRETYIEAAEEGGYEPSEYIEDTTYSSLEESSRLIVITADSVTNYRWDSHGSVAEEHFTHGQWARESDWSNAFTEGATIVTEYADYEGGFGYDDYWGMGARSIHERTTATTPPASWYSRPATDVY